MSGRSPKQNVYHKDFYYHEKYCVACVTHQYVKDLESVGDISIS